MQEKKGRNWKEHKLEEGEKRRKLLKGHIVGKARRGCTRESGMMMEIRQYPTNRYRKEKCPLLHIFITLF